MCHTGPQFYFPFVRLPFQPEESIDFSSEWACDYRHNGQRDNPSLHWGLQRTLRRKEWLWTGSWVACLLFVIQTFIGWQGICNQIYFFFRWKVMWFVAGQSFHLVWFIVAFFNWTINLRICLWSIELDDRLHLFVFVSPFVIRTRPYFFYLLLSRLQRLAVYDTEISHGEEGIMDSCLEDQNDLFN